MMQPLSPLYPRLPRCEARRSTVPVASVTMPATASLWGRRRLSSPGSPRGRPLRWFSLSGAFCQALVIVRDLKHHLLGYFVLHIVGKTACRIGAFAPVLTTTRRIQFVDGHHRLAHSV